MKIDSHQAFDDSHSLEELGLTMYFAASVISKYLSDDSIAHTNKSVDLTHRPEASSKETSLGLTAKRCLAYFFFCANIAEVSSKKTTLPAELLFLDTNSLL
jgi:hypothetical protein